jgi:hypothetical protein
MAIDELNAYDELTALEALIATEADTAQLEVPNNDPVMLGAFKLPVIVNPDPDIINDPVID